MRLLFKLLLTTTIIYSIVGCGSTPVASSDDPEFNKRRPKATIEIDKRNRNVSFKTAINAKKITIINNASLEKKSPEWMPMGGYMRVPTESIDISVEDTFNELIETRQNGQLDNVTLTIVDADLFQSVAVSDWILFVGPAVMNTVQRTLSCTVSINIKFEEKGVRHTIVAFVPKFLVKDYSEIDKDATPYAKGRLLYGVGDCHAVLAEQVASIVNLQAEKLHK